MSIIIRLQNLPWSANSVDIRRFFSGLSIPEGGVHIVGGEMGDAFIAFSTDEDARLAMAKDGGKIKDMQIKLLLSSRTEMMRVIEQARQQNMVVAQPHIIATQPAILTLQQPARIMTPTSESERRRGRSPSPHRRSRDRSPIRDRRRSPDDRRGSKRDRSRSPSRSNRSFSRDMDRRSDRFKREDRRYEDSRYREERRSTRDSQESKRYLDADHVNSRSQLHATEGFRNMQNVYEQPQNITMPGIYQYGNQQSHSVVKNFPDTYVHAPNDSSLQVPEGDPITSHKAIELPRLDQKHPSSAMYPQDQMQFRSPFQLSVSSTKDNSASAVEEQMHKPRRRTRFEPEYAPTQTASHFTTPDAAVKTPVSENQRDTSYNLGPPVENYSEARSTWPHEMAERSDNMSWNEKRQPLLNPPVSKNGDFLQVVPMDLDPSPSDITPDKELYHEAMTHRSSPYGRNNAVSRDDDLRRGNHNRLPPLHNEKSSTVQIENRGPVIQNEGRGPGMQNESRGPGIQNESRSTGIQNEGRGPRIQNEGRPPRMQNEGRNPGMQNDGRDPRMQNEIRNPGMQNEGRNPGMQNEGRNPGMQNEGRNPGMQNEGRNPGMQNEGRGPRMQNEGRDPQIQNEGRGSEIQSENRGPGRQNEGRSPGMQNEGRGPGMQNEGRSPVLRNERGFGLHNEGRSALVHKEDRGSIIHKENRGPPMHSDIQSRIPPSLTVEVRGLPPDARIDDVLDLFQGIPLPAANIRIEASDQGFEKAVIRFVSVGDFDEALRRNRHFMHEGRCELVPCPASAFDSAPRPQKSKPKPKPREEDLTIQMRGLPFSCKDDDVVTFFDGLGILDLFVDIAPDGRASGIGFVEFGTPEDFRSALTMNGKMIGHRYITVSVASKEMMAFARGEEYVIPPKGPHSGSSYTGSSRAPHPSSNQSRPLSSPSQIRPPLNQGRPLTNQGRPPPSGNQVRAPPPPPPCVSMKGLPEGVTNRDIANFLGEMGIMPRAVHIMLRPDKTPSGDAFAEFGGPADLETALEMNGKLMLGKRVLIQPISFYEMSDILGRPTPMPPPPAPTALLRTPGDVERPRRPLLPQCPGELPYRERTRMEPPIRGNRPLLKPFNNHMESGRPFGSGRMRAPWPNRSFNGGGNRPEGRFPPPPPERGVKDFGSPGCVVSINNLHFRAGLEELLDFFQDYKITKDNIIRKYNENGQTTGEARVAFQTPRDAQRVTRELNQKPIMGRPLSLSIL